MIKLLKFHGIDATYSRVTARNMYLKKDTDSDITTISANVTISELEQKMKDRIIEVDFIQMAIKLSYKNRVYLVYPYKNLALTNTYLSVNFVNTPEEDSKTLDFTIDSLYNIGDTFLHFNNSKYDLDNKLINFVGEGSTRIMESKIRMLKAATLLSILGDDWKIGQSTYDAINANAFRIRVVKPTEIKEEIYKVLLEAEKPSIFFYTLKNLGLLTYLFPELERCLTIDQTNKGSHLTLFQHIMLALDSITLDKYQPETRVKLRLSALLHDIGKPYTITNSDSGLHFYQHEFVGAIISEQVLDRWGFGRALRGAVKHLITNHLFDANPGKSLQSIKRLIQKVGPSNILDLIELRRADRSGNLKEPTMLQLDKFKGRVNKILEIEAPNDFILAINEKTLETLKIYAPGMLEHVRKMIVLGALTNKKKTIIDYIVKLANTNCPFDWGHLYKTQEQNISNDVLKFPNGDFQCGAFCDFSCRINKVEKSLLIDTK